MKHNILSYGLCVYNDHQFSAKKPIISWGHKYGITLNSLILIAAINLNGHFYEVAPYNRISIF